MENILKEKTAVVYGAGSIGSAVAAAFAQAGATVFVADHHRDALAKLADRSIRTELLDVLDRDAVAAFVKSVVEKTGLFKSRLFLFKKPHPPFFEEVFRASRAATRSKKPLLLLWGGGWFIKKRTFQWP